MPASKPTPSRTSARARQTSPAKTVATAPVKGKVQAHAAPAGAKRGTSKAAAPVQAPVQAPPTRATKLAAKATTKPAARPAPVAKKAVPKPAVVKQAIGRKAVGKRVGTTATAQKKAPVVSAPVRRPVKPVKKAAAPKPPVRSAASRPLSKAVPRGRGKLLPAGRAAKPIVPAERVVRIRELDPFSRCGPDTSVEQLYRVDESLDGRPTVHLVYLDRHGWYCFHGRGCPAVTDVHRELRIPFRASNSSANTALRARA